jgi:Caspase domain
MIDHSESRAVLIGVSRYEDAAVPDVPAAANSLQILHALLTDPDLCGWPEDRVTVIANPPTASKLAQQLRRLAAETTATLLVYFVGHGTLTDSGELCFVVGETEIADPDLTGLEYRHVRRAVLDSPAQSKIVILDCCYSGKAIQALSADETLFANATEISGAYTLTASDSTAHVPSAEQADHCTSFTEALVDIVRKGLPAAQEFLILSTIYQELRRRLRCAGLPRPNQRGTDTIQIYPFSRNAAFIPGETTGYALTITDDTIYFDLAELSNQVIGLLGRRERQPLSPEALRGMRDGSGLYQLSRVDEFSEEVVYLGTTSTSLPRQLMGLLKKISGRRLLSPDQIRFSHLYFDGDPSGLIPSPLRPGHRFPEWNRNGFGSRDPGRQRDKAQLRADHFDARYPIDLNYPLKSLRLDTRQLSHALRAIADQLPYTFRYQQTAPDFDRLTIEIPSHQVSADELFRHIANALGDSWQLTALPGYVILYRENTTYPAAFRYYRGNTVTDQIPETMS